MSVAIDAGHGSDIGAVAGGAKKQVLQIKTVSGDEQRGMRVAGA
jgi:hypothetical protein